MTVQVFTLKGLEDINENEDIRSVANRVLGTIAEENPYYFMTENYKTVFETLCPVKRDYIKYNQNAIPTRVLEIINDAEKKKLFTKICIWYDDVSPDPVLIGVKSEVRIHDDKKNTFHKDDKRFNTKDECQAYIDKQGYKKSSAYVLDWNSKLYLMARWGDELAPLDVLASRAKAKYLRKEKYDLTKLLTETKTKLDLLDLEADLKFSL